MAFCRLCYTETDPELCANIFSVKFDPPLWRIIGDLTNITINENDPYTKIVCFQCFVLLKRFENFREMVVKTDWRIRYGINCNNPNYNTHWLLDSTNHYANNFQLYCPPKEEAIEIEYNPLQIDSIGTSNRADYPARTSTNDNPDLVTIKTDNSSYNDNKEFVQTSATVDGKDVASSSNTTERFQCGYCSKSFTRKGSLKLHQYSAHRRKHIAVHRKTHKEPITGKIVKNIRNPNFFPYQNNLLANSLMYTKERPYYCNICGKTFTKSYNLKTHSKIHTDEKPYKCSVCDKGFLRKNDIEIHSRVHTGEKPYQCDVCDKRFTQQSGLNLHLKIHSGEKPFVCYICDRGFPRKNDLNVHLRVHTGEKPYECDVCEKKFTQQTALKVHIRTVHHT